MTSPDERKQTTNKAMNDPQPGDLFTEMCSYWVYVAHREGNQVTIIEAFPPCTLPRDVKWSTMSLDEFRQAYAYESTPGYTVTLVERGKPNPAIWYAEKFGKPADRVSRVFQGL